MDNLRLHFAGAQHPDRPLHTGVHRVVRQSGGTLGLGDAAQGALLAQFCVDRRGLWLQVAHGARGIHVNGRPVQRMALLRAGDSVYVDGVEITVRASHQNTDAPPPAVQDNADDPRIVLRGVGGKHHGRSVTLERAFVAGRSADAHLRIDDAAVAERHGQFERRGDRVLFRSLASGATTLVNGVPVRDALLVAGDQIAIEGRHRFVVEVPWLAQAENAVEHGDTGGKPEPLAGEASSPGLQVKRWPWLLLAAALLAALLSALLMWGPR